MEENEDEELFFSINQDSRITKVEDSNISELRNQSMSTENDVTLLGSFHNSSSHTLSESNFVPYDLPLDEFLELDNESQSCIENSPSEATRIKKMDSYGFGKRVDTHDYDLQHISSGINLSEVEKDFSSNNDNSEMYESDTVYCSSDDDKNSESDTENKIENKEISIDSLENVTENCKRKRKHINNDNLTRKRLCKPEKWERNVFKNAVNRGLEHKTLKTDNIIPARTMKRTCGPGCRFKCESKITEGQRQILFSSFWSIPEQSLKYNFIARLVTENSIDTDNPCQKKNFSRTYTLNSNENKVKVCQTMFINTFDISKKMIDTALKKVREGDSVLKDNRGSSKNRPKAIPEETTAAVIEHISMFPKVESHYTRKDSNREYLEEGLSLNSLYRLYTEWAKENEKPIATKHHYMDTFNTKFNISFFKPKKDQCDQCEEFKNTSETKKKRITI